MAPKLGIASRVVKKKATPALKQRVSNRSSSFVQCPACQAQVAISLINLHLDLDCKPSTPNEPLKAAAHQQSLDQTSASASCQKSSDQTSASFSSELKKTDESLAVQSISALRTLCPSSTMNGYHLVEEFISCEEEEQLLLAMDMDSSNAWKPYTFTGSTRGKSYGLVMALGRRQILAAKFEMPKVLQPVIERMRSIPFLADFFPNEMNALEYRKEDGHFLRPHVDDRQLSGLRIVNLSLCGECLMTFKRERGAYECYKIKLKRRSLQILTGESRYNFTHEIENQNLLSPRRVSITFREVALVN